MVAQCQGGSWGEETALPPRSPKSRTPRPDAELRGTGAVTGGSSAERRSGRGGLLRRSGPRVVRGIAVRPLGPRTSPCPGPVKPASGPAGLRRRPPRVPGGRGTTPPRGGRTGDGCGTPTRRRPAASPASGRRSSPDPAPYRPAGRRSVRRPRYDRRRHGPGQAGGAATHALRRRSGLVSARPWRASPPPSWTPSTKPTRARLRADAPRSGCTFSGPHRSKRRGHGDQALAGVPVGVFSAWNDLTPQITREAAFRTSGSLSRAAAPRTSNTVVRDSGASAPSASMILTR